jgi:wyosine [tRNA(Phe)-imidazoG37] synthetase (radical SAM superfamily)
MFTGKIWIEVMLIKDMNDTSEALFEIAHHLKRLKPDGVHITLPIRPPAETGIQPSDEPGMLRAKKILGEIAHVSIPITLEAQATGDGDLCETILNIVTRHPMQEDEIRSLLTNWSPKQIHDGIKDLFDRHLIKIVELGGSDFLSSEAANYHDKTANRSGNPA